MSVLDLAIVICWPSKLETWLANYRMGNGPITKNGRQPFLGGVSQNGRKMAGQMAGQLKSSMPPHRASAVQNGILGPKNTPDL